MIAKSRDRNRDGEAAIAQQLERQIVPPFSAIEADVANGVFSKSCHWHDF